MLRSNSKKAIQHIHDYIITNADFTNYGIDNLPSDFNDVCTFIMKTFYEEFYGWYRGQRNTQNAFIEYLQGLPSVIDSCYYYNRSAVDDLGAILEETEEEKAKYTEQEAERILSCLLYREISKHSTFKF